MKRRYIFEDFQLDNTDNEEEVNMECGITIPIRSIADLPTDIAKIVNDSVSKTMCKFEKRYGRVSNLSTLRLVAWLNVDENNQNDHYIGLILFEDIGSVKDVSTKTYICPKDDCYLNFARYCANKLKRFLFAI